MNDPYWYESNVGLLYMVDMLFCFIWLICWIAIVGEIRLDDVLITYGNEGTKFIQVKYTSVYNPLTLGILIDEKSSNSKYNDLLLSNFI